MDQLLDKISSTISLIDGARNEDGESLDFTPLRKLSQFCSELLINEQGHNESAITFFLSKYIDSLIINFGGDTVSDEEVQKSKRIIYNSILEGLNKLKDALSIKDNERTFSIMNSLIIVYYEHVNILNTYYKINQKNYGKTN